MDAARRSPDDKPPERRPSSSTLRLVRQREHSLESLFELNRELGVSLDAFRIAELALLNLIGHFGTTRAALWAMADEAPRPAVLMRKHGIDEEIARSIGNGLSAQVVDRFEAEETAPIRLEEWATSVSAPGAGLAVENGLAVLAPVGSAGRLFGMLAIGRRLSGEPYSALELEYVGAAAGIVGVAMENTRLYQQVLESNRRLQRANEELAEVDRLKNEFLQTINHELKTPLAILLGFHSTLEEMDPLPESLEKTLAIMKEQTTRLSAMVQDVLDFSSLGQSAAQLQVEDIDLGPILRRYVEGRRPGIVEGLRDFTDAIDPGTLKARVDPRRVLQVLDLLVDNAVKFTPLGSRIGVGAERRLESGTAWLRVSVEDDGPGIAPEHLATLFEPFRQVDGSTTRTAGGMGMGLALAREIVSRMGGRLEVSSTLGEGSSFRLLLRT